MVVSAISAFSSRYAYLQIDAEHDEIKRRLLALGVTPTGSKSVDKIKLEGAERERELEATQKANANQSTKVEEEAAFSTTLIPLNKNTELSIILQQLGITQTDNLEDDYRKAINALRTRFMNEKSMIELTMLRDLKSDLDRIVTDYGYSTISIASSEMTGASALGEMNKVMMLQAGSFSTSGK